MQFFSEGRYVANVVDGKVNFYGGATLHDRAAMMWQFTQDPTSVF